jgi:hypothetical protein
MKFSRVVQKNQMSIMTQRRASCFSDRVRAGVRQRKAKIDMAIIGVDFRAVASSYDTP